MNYFFVFHFLEQFVEDRHYLSFDCLVALSNKPFRPQGRGFLEEYFKLLTQFVQWLHSDFLFVSSKLFFLPKLYLLSKCFFLAPKLLTGIFPLSFFLAESYYIFVWCFALQQHSTHLVSKLYCCYKCLTIFIFNSLHTIYLETT